jgi:hypothetical protein
MARTTRAGPKIVRPGYPHVERGHAIAGTAAFIQREWSCGDFAEAIEAGRAQEGALVCFAELLVSRRRSFLAGP